MGTSETDGPEPLDGPSTVHDRPGPPRVRTPGTPTEDHPRGETIGRYVVIDKVGQGGMGVVYSAYDHALHRRVALKLVRGGPDPRAQALLLAEARTMAQLSHPHIVPVYDAGERGDEVFLAMEFVDGQSLRDWRKASPRTPREILAMYAQAGDALASAHDAGIVHRDFKPDNVLIDAAGRLRVTDFGLAKVDPEAQASAATSLITKHTISGSGAGTPGYMSPEQQAGEPTDARTDQYAWCAAVVEALTGTLPIPGDPIGVPGLAASTVAALRRGLAEDADARWPSMRPLLAEVAPRTRTWRGPAIVAGVIGAAVIGGAVVIAHGRGAAPVTCDSSPAIAAHWNAETRAQVAAAFSAHGGDSASFAEAIDRWSTSWREMSDASCTATARGEQSQDLLDLRTSCLALKLQIMTNVIDTAAHADADLVRRAPTSDEARLPNLAECADIVTLLGFPALPEDVASRTQIASAKTAFVAAAETSAIFGHYQEEIAEMHQAIRELGAADYLPLRYELNAVLGLAMLDYDAGIDETSKQLWDTVALDPVRGDNYAVQLWLALVWSVGNNEGRPEEGLRIGAIAESLARQAHSPPRVMASLDNRMGSLLTDVGRPDEALVRLARAEATFDKDGDVPELVAVLRTEAAARMTSGDFTRAIPTLERALALAKTESLDFGDVQTVLVQLGVAYATTGRLDDSIEVNKRTLELLAGRDDAPSVFVDAHTNLAVAYKAKDDLANAEKYATEGLAYARAHIDGDTVTLQRSLATLAEIHIVRGDDALALPLLEDAIAVMRKAVAGRRTGHFTSPAKVLWLLSDARLAVHDPHGALAAAGQSVELVEQNEASGKDRAQAYGILAQARWANGDRAGAHDAMHKAMDALDGLARAGTDVSAALASIKDWLAKHPKS